MRTGGSVRRRAMVATFAVVGMLGSFVACPLASAAESSPPSAPTGLATVVGATSVTLTWSPPTSTDGVAVNYYVATSLPAATGCTVVVSLGEPTTCTFSNLVQGTSYTFSVAATTIDGLTGPPAQIGPVTPEAAPSAPTSVTTVPSGSTLSVSWTAPSSTGGSALVSSSATALTPSGAAVATCTAAAPATTCTIEGLDLGGSFSVTVTATNAAGLTSAASLPSASSTLAYAPAAPSTVTVTAADSTAIVSWDSSASSGGRSIAFYTATAFAGSTPAGTCTALPVTAGPLSCTISHLVNGTSYSASVTATNSVGTSTASTSSAPFTPEIGNPASFDAFVTRIIANSKVDITASGSTYTLVVPPTSRVLGIALHGTLQIHVDTAETSTWTASATLPEIFGGASGTLHAVIVNNVVTSLSISATTASIAGLFTVDRITLVYGPAGWTIDGTASIPSQESSSLGGSLTISPTGTISGGLLHLAGLSLAGLVDLSSFTLTYASSTGWSGAATFANLLTGTPNGSGASIRLGFSPAGRLTSGSIDANGPVSIFGVIELRTFRLGFDPTTNGWDANLAAAIPSTSGSSGTQSAVSIALGTANGAITGASFSLTDLSFAGVMTLNTASFTYSAATGHEDFNVAVTVTLPGAHGTAIAGRLHIVDGTYAAGSITGTHLSVHLLSGVYLQTIGVAIDTPTATEGWRIAGSIGASYGPSLKSTTLVELTGGLSYTFPHSGTGIGTYELTGAFGVGGVTIGNGQLLVGDSPTVHATVTLGPGDGSEGLALGTVAQATGVLHGSFTASSFSLTGTATITVGGAVLAADLHVDATGAAFCTTFPLVGRGGVLWVWGTPARLVGPTCSTAGF